MDKQTRDKLIEDRQSASYTVQYALSKIGDAEMRVSGCRQAVTEKRTQAGTDPSFLALTNDKTREAFLRSATAAEELALADAQTILDSMRNTLSVQQEVVRSLEFMLAVWSSYDRNPE